MGVSSVLSVEEHMSWHWRGCWKGLVTPRSCLRFLLKLFACLFVMEVREHLEGVCLLLSPSGSLGLNSGLWAC